MSTTIKRTIFVPACAQCGAVGTDAALLWMDHRNADATNNDPANLRMICETCMEDAFRAVIKGEPV